MYAILRQGGHQYRVSPGDMIQIELISGEKNDVVTFDDVLLISNEGNVEIGEPKVAGASITAKVLRSDRGPKVIVYKMRRRKGFAKTMGHRQSFTEVRIQSINKNGSAL